MSLSPAVTHAYVSILREELVPAMGCTEPIAIAYAAAILRHALGAEPRSLQVSLSGNIIKNVKSVIVPATEGMRGIEAAVAAGIVAGCPHRRLEVLCALKPADVPRIRGFLAAVTPVVRELDTDLPFELIMTGEAVTEEGEVSVRVHLAERHTGVVSVTRSAQGREADLTADYALGNRAEGEERADRALRAMQGGERVAAVEKIEQANSAMIFSGTATGQRH